MSIHDICRSHSGKFMLLIFIYDEFNDVNKFESVTTKNTNNETNFINLT